MLDEPEIRRRPVIPGPKEGWMSVILLGVMLLSLCWAIQAAEWLPQLEFLVPVSLFALISGLVLGTSRLSVAIAIPISAVVGAATILWSVGGEYHPELDQLARLDALRDAGLSTALTVYRYASVQEATVLAIAMGVLLWVTAYTAAFAVYRRHHVLDAILLIGAFLVINLVATVQELFGFLVLFSLAALLLWLRAALVERRSNWQDRRVSENLDVPASIMRSGVIFTAVAIGLAWFLTSVAVAAPLTSAVRSLDDIWLDFASEASGFFQGLNSSNARPVSAGFGPSIAVGPSWSSSDDPVLRLTSDRPYYLRAKTYDHYTGRGWSWSSTAERSVDLEQPVFSDWSPERPMVEEGFEVVTVGIQMLEPQGRDLYTPGFPDRFYAPITVTEPTGRPVLAGLGAAGPVEAGQAYEVKAVVSQVTEAQLAAASTDYEPEVAELYLDLTGVTEPTRQLALAISEGQRDPYHRAKAIAAFLRGEGFAYDTSVTPPPATRDLVDYFLFDPSMRRGFCTYYASAMVLMARSVGIPARLAVGYAPGSFVESGVYESTKKDAHAWAELYFPGYGWQIFEATKGIDPKFRRLSGDSGAVPPPLSGRGVDSQGPFDPDADPQTSFENPNASYQPIPGGVRAGEDLPADVERTNQAWIFLILLGLALAYGAYRWFAARRRFRFLSPGDRGWARMNLAAQRAGIGREPSETYYEYASWLETELPNRAQEIRTIADGKVYSSYSGRSMSERAIEAIERAWDRLRLPLTGLAVRRRLRTFFGRPV
jgi:transglutaminase-like putative cysteine protease